MRAGVCARRNERVARPAGSATPAPGTRQKFRRRNSVLVTLAAATARRATHIVGEIPGRLEVSAAGFEIRVEAAIIPIHVRMNIGVGVGADIQRSRPGVSERLCVISLESALRSVQRARPGVTQRECVVPLESTLRSVQRTVNALRSVQRSRPRVTE